MWKWIVIGLVAAGAGCGREGLVAPDVGDTSAIVSAPDAQGDHVAAAPTRPRVLNTPVREGAVRIVADATYPAGEVPGHVRAGWRLAVVSERATWDAFVKAAGWRAGDLVVDWEREVIVFVAHRSIGGYLTYAGVDIQDGRAVLRYGPSSEFGPAWVDAGALILAVPVPRAGLKRIDFVNSGRLDLSLPYP